MAIGNKRNFNKLVKSFPLEMNGLFTREYLNILPLCSYYLLIGMDFLEAHIAKMELYDKTFEYIDEEGIPITLRGIPNDVYVRYISSM